MQYPKYENHDAIEVPFTECIPSDYDGVMGVPITFMDKYNPEQFELVDSWASHSKTPAGIENECGYINGRWIFKRIAIRHKKGDNV